MGPEIREANGAVSRCKGDIELCFTEDEIVVYDGSPRGKFYKKICLSGN